MYKSVYYNTIYIYIMQVVGGFKTNLQKKMGL